MSTLKTIEIFGWLSDREVAKGKTAIWTGSEVWETCEIDGPYWSDTQIVEELLKAQDYVNEHIELNKWTISATAQICRYECEEA